MMRYSKPLGRMTVLGWLALEARNEALAAGLKEASEA
jgi:hypothetical protein